MIQLAKKQILTVTEKFHNRIFGHQMSPFMGIFLRSLSWSFIGIIFSSFFLFLGTVLIGRFLGPAEYGKYNLIFAISNMAVVVMFLGFDTTAVKFISESDDEQSKRSCMSNSFWAFMVSGIIVSVVAIFSSGFIADLISTDIRLVQIALILAFVVALKTLLDSFLKAFHEFKKQAYVKIMEGGLFLFLVAGFIFFAGSHSYAIFLVPTIIGALFGIVIYGKSVFRKLRRWDSEVFFKSKNYVKLALATSFIGIFISTIDRFFIVKFLGMQELGIYSAYLMSSTVIIGQFILSLSNVFFPMVNKVEDKKMIFSKINRLMVFAFIPIVVSVFVLSFFILKIFGLEYGVNWTYVLAVSFISFLQILTAFYGAITASSVPLFSFASKIYYLKPFCMLFLYFVIYSFGVVSLMSIFLILILSYVYDIINTMLAFKFVKN